MLNYNLIIGKLKKFLKNHNNKLNIYLIAISVTLAILNIIFLKNIELGIFTTIFNNYFNDFLAAILILAYINICLSFIDYEIKSLKILIPIILIMSFVWEYTAIFIKQYSVFDYLDIMVYLIGTIVYWSIINILFK